MLRVYIVPKWYQGYTESIDVTEGVCDAAIAYYPGETGGSNIKVSQELLFYYGITPTVWSTLMYGEFTRADGVSYTIFSGLVTSAMYDSQTGLWDVKIEPLESLFNRQHLTAEVSLSRKTQADICAALVDDVLPLCHTVNAGSTVKRDRTYAAYDTNSVLTLLLNLSEVINGPDWYTYYSPRYATFGGLTYPQGYSLVVGDDLSTGEAVNIDTTFLVDAKVEYSGGNNAYQTKVVALSRNEDSGDLVAFATRVLPDGSPPSVLIDTESNSTQLAALQERAEGLLATYSDGVTSVDLTYSLDVLGTDTSPVPLPLMLYRAFAVLVPVAGVGYQTMTGIYGGCSYEFGSSGWLIKPRLQVVA